MRESFRITTSRAKGNSSGQMEATTQVKFKQARGKVMANMVALLIVPVTKDFGKMD